MSGTAELTFRPLGAHNSGLAIATAQLLARPSAGVTQVMIQALTQNVRLTLDGTTPSTTVGFQIKAGDPPVIFPLAVGGQEKVIEEAATANLQFQYGGF
jgi:hypothetical protein